MGCRTSFSKLKIVILAALALIPRHLKILFLTVHLLILSKIPLYNDRYTQSSPNGLAQDVIYEILFLIGKSNLK